MLAEHAAFHVNINSGGRWRPFKSPGRRSSSAGARWNWVTSTVGIIHDGDGQLQPLRDQERESLHGHALHGKSSYAQFNYFQDNIAHGKRTTGAAAPRALTSTSAKTPGALLLAAARLSRKPLLEYTVEDIRREYRTAKSCAPRCTVACVAQVAYIDSWRGAQDWRRSPAENRQAPGCAASVRCYV